MREPLPLPLIDCDNARVPFTVVLPTEYGLMLVNRHDLNQTQYFLQTGRAVDDVDIKGISQVIEPGSIAIDAGACFGAWTLQFARRAARVYSFEAQRIVYQQLCGSIALNGLENVFAYNVALSSLSEQTIDVPKYDYNKTLQVGGVFFCKPGKHMYPGQETQPPTETVKTARIDDYHLTNVSLIKIDVEGMELEVLEGAMETIKSSRPCLYIETLLLDDNKILESLRDLDYDFVDRNKQDVFCLPKEKWNARRNDDDGLYTIARK